MNSEVQENELLIHRVHQLEKEVRRMKQAGVAAAAVPILLLIVFQIHDHRKLTSGRVVANEIALTDNDGNTRVRLAVFPEGSGLEIYAASGERRVQLVGSGEQANLNLYLPVTAVHEAAAVSFFHDNLLLSSFRTDGTGASLEMHSKAAHGTVALALEGNTASLMLSGTDEKVPKLRLSSDPTQACTALGGIEESSAGSSLCLHSPGLPSLELADVSGNRAVVGIPHSSDLNAGPGSSEGSAASLILKHKSGSKVHVTPRNQKE